MTAPPELPTDPRAIRRCAAVASWAGGLAGSSAIMVVLRANLYVDGHPAAGAADIIRDLAAWVVVMSAAVGALLSWATRLDKPKALRWFGTTTLVATGALVPRMALIVIPVAIVAASSAWSLWRRTPRLAPPTFIAALAVPGIWAWAVISEAGR